MDTSTIIKHYVATHNASSHALRAQPATLRKVAARAVSSWEQAPIRGASSDPFVHSRLAAFCKALVEGTEPQQDVDLLPHQHPCRNAADPWAALVSAEDRLASLAKSAIGAISRVSLRKQTLEEITKAHQSLVHLYDLNFAVNSYEVSGTGVVRADLVKATAQVHEEMERRGIEIAPQHSLYKEAFELRSTPVQSMKTGTVLQCTESVVLDLPGLGALSIPTRKTCVDLAKGAEAFSADGSKYHLPIREPAEIQYSVEVGKADGHAVGAFSFAAGAQTPAFTEVFVSGAINGVLIVGKHAVSLRKELQPFVLTETAVDAGWMPPDGDSALPPSLELDVPPELRFWKAADGESPQSIRDQLVKSDILGPGNIALVDGQLRRIVTKVYVAEAFEPAPSTFAHGLNEDSALDAVAADLNTTVLKASEAGAAVAAGTYDVTEDERLFYLADPASVGRLAELDLDYYTVAMPDKQETRKALELVGRPYVLDTSGTVFASSHAIAEAVYVQADEPAIGKSGDVAKAVKLLKAEDTEQRYVLGIVLEPETVDAQQDIYSADEIRKSAHTFLAEYRNVGLQHTTLVNDKVRIVESYLAPCDMTVGEQVVKSGTWMLGLVVDDDDIWAAVKDGSLTGLSIGGSAIRTDDI